MTCC